MLDYEKLYRPYSVEGNSLDRSISWLRKVTNAQPIVIEHTVAFVMSELSDGKSFLHKCECGCDLENPYTAIEHYMRDIAFRFQKEADKAFINTIEEKEKKRIEYYLKKISKENKKFVKEQFKKLPLYQRPTFFGRIAKFFSEKAFIEQCAKNYRPPYRRFA